MFVELLFEEIYSGKAVVYHRTNEKDLINLIYKEGYKPKDRSNYGIGMYATYNLKTQTNSEFGMKYMYGPIIVKLMINSINNFLILDYKEFIKTNLFKKLKSTKKTFIVDQLKHFNFNFLQPIEDFEYTKKGYSSDILDRISFYFGGDFVIKRGIDGVVFTSEDEGKNVVCYNTDLIIPLSFSLDEGKTWIKANKDRNYLKKVFSQYNDDIKLKYKKDAKIKHWIDEAKISKDADFTIPNLSSYDIKYNNKVNWNNGVWYEGTWVNGYWYNGIWKKGTWLDGTFFGEIWEDGTWKKGTWLGRGIELGAKKSIWKKGIWESGVWEGGVWESGDWLDGTWKGGTWKGGTWHGGKDRYDRFHAKGDSPDKWKI